MPWQQHGAICPIQTGARRRECVQTVVIVVVRKARRHLKQVGDQRKRLSQCEVEVFIARPWYHGLITGYEHAGFGRRIEKRLNFMVGQYAPEDIVLTARFRTRDAWTTHAGHQAECAAEERLSAQDLNTIAAR